MCINTQYTTTPTDISIHPQNTTVELGSQITLNCSIMSKCDNVSLQLDGCNDIMQVNDIDVGHVNHTIKQVKLSDAGVYTCNAECDESSTSTVTTISTKCR